MTDIAEKRVSVPARYIAAVVVGNALEFYDFLTYAYFAVYIGRAFFPSKDPSASLLASLGTFAVGFLVRPIGGWVIGRMGDRMGRKPAMIFSFSLMGVAMAGLALTPPYSMINLAAPVLVIIFRMMQGFALGGEIGPTTAFLLEAAPAERRGFYTAFQWWSQQLAILISGLAGLGLAIMLSGQQLQDFGWRIAFLFGAAIVPFGLMLRRSMPETFHPPQSPSAPVPLRPYFPIAVVGLMLLASATVGFYIQTYMTTYAIVTLHMRANVAFAATIVVGLCGVAFVLVSGDLSDRVGRRSMMLVPGVLLLVSILPAFYLIAHYRTTAILLGATAVLSSLWALYSCPIVIWLTESLPVGIRSGGVGVVYAVSIATFGGTTQYAVTWLIKLTGKPLVPGSYWTLAMLIGLVAVIAARETSPSKINKPEVLPVLVAENAPGVR